MGTAVNNSSLDKERLMTVAEKKSKLRADIASLEMQMAFASRYGRWDEVESMLHEYALKYAALKILYVGKNK